MRIAKSMAAGVILICVICCGCAMLDSLGMRKPSASLHGLKFQDVSLDSATLMFDVEVDNPYPAALPLVNMDYDLTTQGGSLFSGSADVQGSVPANGKKVVSLPAKIKYLDLVKAFKGIKPGEGIPYKANVGLGVEPAGLGRLRLPISKEGTLTAPSIPNIESFDWQKILKK